MPFDPAPAAELQRAVGRAEVAVRQSGGRDRLERLYQQGCGKALLPNPHGGLIEAVLINTSGGVAGGDRLDWGLAAGDGAALVATTQAAERIYRSTGAEARIATRLTLGAGARIDWLPQETILYDGARLARTLDVEMAEDAQATLLETLVLGRAAMGETVRHAWLSDQWRLRRGGRLVHAEALRIDGDLAELAGPALLDGLRAFATLIVVAPHAETRIDAARALLDGIAGVAAAASAKPGLLILRFLGPDAQALRTGLTRFLAAFRAAPLPRVWSL